MLQKYVVMCLTILVLVTDAETTCKFSGRFMANYFGLRLILVNIEQTRMAFCKPGGRKAKVRH